MSQHVYWTAQCKTRNCRPMFLSYIGEAVSGATYQRPYLYEHPLRCGTCGQTHNYSTGDLNPYTWDYPPAPDFRSRLDPASDSEMGQG